MKTTTKKYELTEAHRAKLKPWADRWIANALNTTPMDDKDRRAMKRAVNGMFQAAKLDVPGRVIFCASPISMAIAGSVAAGVWWLRDNPKEAAKLLGAAPSEAELAQGIYAAVAFAVARGMSMTRDLKPLETPVQAQRSAATRAATRDATGAATWAATRAATEAATRAATWAATGAATWAATEAATRAATRAATWDATEAATRAGSLSPVAQFLISCCARWDYFWDGGNQYSGWVSYFSFFRHVSKLDLPVYDKFKHYEAAAIHGGPRFMHRRFCIVSDRPTVVARDEQNRPHCETGPFIAWRDGWALYAWHGTRVPADWIEHRKTLDPKIALTDESVERRRAAAEMIGWNVILDALKPRVIEQDEDPLIGTLLEVDLPDAPASRFLRVQCGTNRIFALPVPREMKTALEANSWTFDVPQIDVKKLEVRT